MKVLVLSVDRDDDFGKKAGLNSPFIGREENANAIMALGLKDPEDSDVNTCLAALSIYDEMQKKGEDVEIATICGDVKVGYESDLVLTTQLENVLELVKPDRVILVSDGAEDEFIYPMVFSRVKVDSVRRVWVKQAPTVEGTYYIIMKMLADDKMRKRIFTPMGLVLAVLGLFNILPPAVKLMQQDASIELIASMGWGMIALVMGLYLLFFAFKVAERVEYSLRNTATAIKNGSQMIPYAILSVILFSGGHFLCPGRSGPGHRSQPDLPVAQDVKHPALDVGVLSVLLPDGKVDQSLFLIRKDIQHQSGGQHQPVRHRFHITRVVRSGGRCTRVCQLRERDNHIAVPGGFPSGRVQQPDQCKFEELLSPTCGRRREGARDTELSRGMRMEWARWKPLYLQILSDFHYDPEGDIQAAMVLSKLVETRRIPNYRTIVDKLGKHVSICGASSSLEKEISNLSGDETIISAGSATSRLMRKGIMPDIVVTDLDGEVEYQVEASSKGALLFVHAHGDNIPALHEIVPKLDRPHRSNCSMPAFWCSL